MHTIPCSFVCWAIVNYYAIRATCDFGALSYPVPCRIRSAQSGSTENVKFRPTLPMLLAAAAKKGVVRKGLYAYTSQRPAPAVKARIHIALIDRAPSNGLPRWPGSILIVATNAATAFWPGAEEFPEPGSERNNFEGHTSQPGGASRHSRIERGDHSFLCQSDVREMCGVRYAKRSAANAL
jgi:hypothetical protein